MTAAQIAVLITSIVEHFSDTGAGYCDVPSVSRPGLMHRVYFNDNLYSQSCTCEAGSFGGDCGHRLAVDRHFDEKRKALRAITGEDLQAHVEDELRTRFNPERWCKETWCCGHWWRGDVCLYGLHDLSRSK